MNDDIVTRLRECWCPEAISDRGLFDPACDHDGVLGEAADEIERLRMEVDKWKKVARERNPKSWANLVRKKYGMEDMYER